MHLTHAEMERTDHEEVRFPLLIPENLLGERKCSRGTVEACSREEGVDPDDLREEDEEGGFQERSLLGKACWR